MAKVIEQRGLGRTDDSSLDIREPLPFPESTYLIDESRSVVYVPIPKVACTSLKTWFLQTAPGIEISPDPETWKVNLWLGEAGRRYLLSDLAPLRDDGYFRFAFVRDPWSRLVSAFLNRIVGRGIEYQQLMARLSRGPWYRVDKKAHYGLRKKLTGVGWSERAEITFRQFVMREVRVTDPAEMDPHWRPQNAFLADHPLDFVGRFERLGEDLAALATRLGASGALPQRNRSIYAVIEEGRCFADCPQATLRALPAMPPYRSFYTPDLVDEVARVYAADIARFGYDY